MKRPNTKAVSMVTRCGSLRHQSAITSKSRSGAGCHRRQGSSESSHTSIKVNQMNKGLVGRFSGVVSSGWSALRPEFRCAGSVALLLEWRSIFQTLLGIDRRDIDLQHQEMPMPFGMRQGCGHGKCKAGGIVALDLIDLSHRQAGREHTTDTAGDQDIARSQVYIGGQKAHLYFAADIAAECDQAQAVAQYL